MGHHLLRVTEAVGLAQRGDGGVDLLGGVRPLRHALAIIGAWRSRSPPCRTGPDAAASCPPRPCIRSSRASPAPTDPRVLVDASTADDAAVVQVSDDLAIVQTVDFFTPIVDDPYDFGRIAATNALSDIYAMGATPVSALNLVAFPLERLGGDVLREVLRGGHDAVDAAGASIVGGHSIDDPEPKYGLAVTGIVRPDAVLTNSGGRPGDELYLTKPLGAGAVATAVKRGFATPELVARATAVMVQLNRDAAGAARAAGASALTDVTGFGLLGHLHELALAGGTAAEIDAAAVPSIEGVLELLERDDAVAGGSQRNRDYAEGFTTFAGDVPEARRRLLADAMTSGGLLAAVPPGAQMPGARSRAPHRGRAGRDQRRADAREQEAGEGPDDEAGGARHPARLVDGERHERDDEPEDERADEVGVVVHAAPARGAGPG